MNIILVILRKECDKMNNSVYEEYMRSVLGYQPVSYNNTYDMEYDRFDMLNMTAMNNLQSQELENCYPDIYKIVYPMVQKACDQNTRAITKDLIESMTDEIYSIIEDETKQENRNNSNKDEKTEKIAENRQSNKNQGLNDLIRILILRELLGNPRPPMRPPMGPPPPMRPPRPQPRPGMGPFNRGTVSEYDNLYEY